MKKLGMGFRNLWLGEIALCPCLHTPHKVTLASQAPNQYVAAQTKPSRFAQSSSSRRRSHNHIETDLTNHQIFFFTLTPNHTPDAHAAPYPYISIATPPTLAPSITWTPRIVKMRSAIPSSVSAKGGSLFLGFNSISLIQTFSRRPEDVIWNGANTPCSSPSSTPRQGDNPSVSNKRGKY